MAENEGIKGESRTKMHKTPSSPAAVAQSQSITKAKAAKSDTSKSGLHNISSIGILDEKESGLKKSLSKVRMYTSSPKKETDSSLTGMQRTISGKLGSDGGMEASYKKSGSRSKLAIGSTISIRKSSLYGESYGERGRAPRYMNTYKLYSDNPFNVEKVEKILQAVMIETLEDLTYDPDKCPKHAKKASSVIRAKVKELEFDRYKLVCMVTIGEKQSQDVFVSCRFLWDAERDRYAKYVHENMHVFGIAMCFGIYYE